MKKFMAFFLIISILISCSACKKTNKKQSAGKINSQGDAPTSSDGETLDEDTEDTEEDKQSDWYDDSFNGDASYDDFSSDSYSSNNSSSVKPAIRKSRIPDGSKKFDGNYNNYFSIAPEYEHPGVVNYDAEYKMLISDYAGKRVNIKNVDLTVNNPKVKISGSIVIIPYEVRKGYDRVVVTVKDKKDSRKKGSYRFNFLQFTEKPTFSDDFAEDYGNWVKDTEGGDFGLGLPVIKNGCMEMTINGKEMTNGIRSCYPEKQAYGCFSASMKMPMDSNVVGSFWLFTSSGYIPNPEAINSTCGEIDIVEYLTGSRIASMTVHWFDYGEFHRENNSSPVFIDAAKFCTYSVVWAPEKIFWYIDGKLYKVASGLEEGAGNGRGGMYPILQAGYFTDDRGFNPTDKLPATVYVDWVDIYGLVMD